MMTSFQKNYLKVARWLPRGPAAASRLAAVLVIGLALTGCKSGPPRVTKAFDISMKRSPELRDDAIEVDIIGADESLRKFLASATIDDYFNPGSQRRRDALLSGKTFAFRAGGDASKAAVLSRTDPLWERWKAKRATCLVIIANLRASVPGGNDSRREEAPIDLGKYEKQARKKKLVEVTLLPSRIDVPPHD